MESDDYWGYVARYERQKTESHYAVSHDWLIKEFGEENVPVHPTIDRRWITTLLPPKAGLYEDDYTKPWGVVQCKYKDSSNVEHLYIYYLTGFSQGIDIASYNTYDLTDNAIIQGNTWTETQISEICQQIADNIEGVTYMPVEFVGRGLPYVEAGDTFEILTASNDSITTIVLNRTITGEQVLTDSYKSVS